MAQKQPSIFRKIADTIVDRLGYTTFKKEQFKSYALNAQARGYAANPEQIKKYGMQKPGKITFKQLRQMAKYDGVIRICVNRIKKAVSQADWSIGVSNKAPLKPEAYESLIKKAEEMFLFMNSNGETMRVLLDRIMEDLLVLDAAAIELVWDNDRKAIVGLNSVDGATIRPVYNAFGELDQETAYKQVINGNKVVAEFRQDELLYIMANPQNDMDLFGYGMSNIESVVLQVQAAMEADMYNIKQFSKDNVPPGMLDLGDLTNEQAEEFVATWNATVQGSTQGMKFIWGSAGDKKWIPFNGSNKDMQYAEYIDWLSRIKLAAYGLTTLDANITQDINRSTGDAQINNSIGVMNNKKLIEEYFTRGILRKLGEDFKRLEFKFEVPENLVQKKTQAEIDCMYVAAQILDPNEPRLEMGLEPRVIEMVAYEKSFDEEEPFTKSLYANG